MIKPCGYVTTKFIMAYALLIRNRYGFIVVEHVASSPEEKVYNLACQLFTKINYPDIDEHYSNAYKLTHYIKEKYPNFVIKETTFDVESLFK